MTDLDKLEFIHHAIQEAMVYDVVDKHDYDLLQRSLSFVEDLREPLLQLANAWIPLPNKQEQSK